MYVVYVLYSLKFDKIYVGITSDLIARFHSHNELSPKGWTKNFRPWTVFHLEFLESKKEALKREKQLKSAKGREWIRNEIKSDV
ncbi:MAG: GIY-YIG nuclease family protein [Chlorobi bacterium]|nr:GIY-YIG nuclease family protein [Chlorobiota bacterium]